MTVGRMSGFSNVDQSPSPDTLIEYLRSADRGLEAMKAYMTASAAQRSRGGPVLDLGCGLGFDLARLERAGVSAIGVDASLVMLARVEGPARTRLIAADAARLPLRDGSVDGVRVERVLQHVEHPEAVVAEIARVVDGDGFVLAFEPDYSTFTIDSDTQPPHFVSSLLLARHPRIGGELAEMFERAGFRVRDVVTESSRGYDLRRLPVDVNATLARAVTNSWVEQDAAAAWLAEQQARTDTARFRARWDKILLVASRA